MNLRKELALFGWFISCLCIDTHKVFHRGLAGQLLHKSCDVLILEFTPSCDSIPSDVVGAYCLTSNSRTWPNQRDVNSVIRWIMVFSSCLLGDSSSWLLCSPEESCHAIETHGTEDKVSWVVAKTFIVTRV